MICIRTPDGIMAFVETGSGFSVKVTKSLLDELDGILGGNCCKVKPKPDVPAPRPKYNRDWEKKS